MNWCQKIISGIYRPNSILKADIVSFDIFDTLIRRNVLNPIHIFELVQSEFENLTGKRIENYAKLRCESEKISWKRSNAEEIMLNQIFDNYEICFRKREEAFKGIRN